MSTVSSFRRTVWRYYKKHGRDTLPWRTTRNPYRILVSEIMLQQTQVERVLPYYKTWIKIFPTARALARASLADVLKIWQGLGYNRRAKMLHQTGRVIAALKTFPHDVGTLEQLPGVGAYTARAVMAFAYNADMVCVETNIRTAVMHHFFPHQQTVDDKDIVAVLEKTLPKGSARAWYFALMDYGAHLKRSGVRLNAKTKGYAKQSTFKGSDREARGAILRALITRHMSESQLCGLLGKARKAQMKVQVGALKHEGFITNTRQVYRLVS